jgi:hypothetical protein
MESLNPKNSKRNRCGNRKAIKWRVHFRSYEKCFNGNKKQKWKRMMKMIIIYLVIYFLVNTVKNEY